MLPSAGQTSFSRLIFVLVKRRSQRYTEGCRKVGGAGDRTPVTAYKADYLDQRNPTSRFLLSINLGPPCSKQERPFSLTDAF